MTTPSTIHRSLYAGLSLIAALLLLGITATQSQASFGISGFEVENLDENGDSYTQAGGHPFVSSVNLDLNTTTDSGGATIGDGNLRNQTVELPPGFIGDPGATTTKCTEAELVVPNAGSASCPISSQVGSVQLNGFGAPIPVWAGVYNMVPQPGQPAQFGFQVLGIPVHLVPEVRSGGDYGLTVRTENISEAPKLYGATVDLWGVPYDSAHDGLRGEFATGGCVSIFGPTGQQCPVNDPPKAFLSNPTDCSHGPFETTLKVESWDGVTDQATVLSEDANGDPSGVTGCEKLDFSPSLTLNSGSARADSPAPIEVNLSMPYNDDPGGLAHAHLKRAVVTLPEGMAINPSSADGLGACSPGQIALESDAKADCPGNSKIGTVEIDTPLLDERISGSVYLAEQHNNPFNSDFAIYLAAEARGVVIKLPGEISPDQQTGRLQATFDNNPQLPFTNLTVRFKGGPRAALVTPATCGTYDVVAEMSPWSAADPDNPTVDEIVTSTSTFTINKGPSGGPCLAGDPGQPGNPADLVTRPFSPNMSAGVTNPVAGAYSPFILRLTRQDGEQEILSTTVTPPQGVTAKLAGVPLCSGAQANAGTCPAASQVGEVIVGAGAGPSPFYIQPPNEGHVYMTEAYKGQQLGMLIQVPAKAGPFDLGLVNVRAAVHVNKHTAQLRVISDPIPQILEGVPLRVKDIRVKINRPGFTVAPTDCDPMTVAATVRGSHGAVANLANRFQVGGCASLGFNPKLRLDFGKSKKNTKRNAHPPLHANLSFNQGDANISSVEVALPKGVLLDQARLGRICSRANYAAETCPEESIVGHAKATTPLLDNPVQGTVYLKSSNNPLPDLAADLNGQIDIDLFGMIDQKENKNGLNQIRNTFDVVPDVPVSNFQLTLDGGSDGLLVNSQNICKTKRAQKVKIDIEAHNEMTLSERPLIGSACKQINKKKAKKLKQKARKLKRKAKKTKKKARQASGKKANKLQRKSKKLNKKSKKLKKQARKLGR